MLTYFALLRLQKMKVNKSQRTAVDSRRNFLILTRAGAKQKSIFFYKTGVGVTNKVVTNNFNFFFKNQNRRY